MKIFTCKHCNEKFIPTRTELEDYYEGWSDKPDTCKYCLAMNSRVYEDYEQVSDADLGQ